MSVDRISRVNELLKREIADCLFREMNEPEYDPATVLVTRVETSRDLHRARVYVSVTGTEAQQRHTLNLLQRHRRALQSRINRDVHLKYTPQLSFHLDGSIAHGDHILHVLSELEAEMEPGAADTDSWKDDDDATS